MVVMFFFIIYHSDLKSKDWQNCYAKPSQYIHMAKLNASAAQGLRKATSIIIVLQTSPIFSLRVIFLICVSVQSLISNLRLRLAAHQRSLNPSETKTK